MPDQLGWAAISAVHCVKASTNTRSKKSSSGLTVSRSRSSTPSRRARRPARGVIDGSPSLLPAAVLGVGDVLAPVGLGPLPVRDAFRDGEVRHEVIGRGAVPMPLVAWRLDHVAGANRDDVAAARLNDSCTLGD